MFEGKYHFEIIKITNCFFITKGKLENKFKGLSTDRETTEGAVYL